MAKVNNPTIRVEDFVRTDLTEGGVKNPLHTFDTTQSIAQRKPMREGKVAEYNPFRAIFNLKQAIVNNLRPDFLCIWKNIYIRNQAVNGNASVFRNELSDNKIRIAESVSSEIDKLVSIVTREIKHPVLKTTSEGFDENALEIANTFIYRLFYNNINHIIDCFSESLQSGISFLHFDTRKTSEKNTVDVTPLSAYKCMWDLTKRASDIHKGDFFFIEEVMSRDAARSIVGSNPVIEKALNSSKNAFDTFMLNQYSRYYNSIGANTTVKKGEQVKVEGKNFSNQTVDEYSVDSSVVTTLYWRKKQKTSKGEYVENIDRAILINNIVISTETLNTEFIPIVSIAARENMSNVGLNDRYRAIYDAIKLELRQSAILHSSLADCMVNSTKNNIFYNEKSIRSNFRDTRVMKNDIIGVTVPTGEDLGSNIFQAANPGLPPSTIELYSLITTRISHKLNILSETNQANSAEQEQLRQDNQIVLNSYLSDSLLSAGMQFGDIIKGMFAHVYSMSEEAINRILPDELKIKNIDQFSKVFSIINDSIIDLDESEYFTTKSEKDIRSLERVSKFLGEKPNLTLSSIMKALNISEEITNDVRKAEQSKMQLEQAEMELKIAEQELRKRKIEAEIKKLEAEAKEKLAKANKENIEAKSSLEEENAKEKQTKQ